MKVFSWWTNGVRVVNNPIGTRPLWSLYSKPRAKNTGHLNFF